jgi:uncharacterized membrane protein
MSLLVQVLHGMAATAWVGGIFFAFMALRPAANTALEPPLRLKLWQAAFSRFFPWVWLFIATLLVTGYVDLFGRFGGFANPALYLKVMHGVGLLMVALFAYLYFGLYRRLSLAVAKEDTPAAAQTMARIRPIIAVNLSLGLLLVVVGTAGPYL